MIMNDEEREFREPWGEFERASHDVIQTLYEARDALPDGESKNIISALVWRAETELDEAVGIAQAVAHHQRPV